MTNEEKAKEIAERWKKEYWLNEYEPSYSESECYMSAMNMAKWKDELFKKDMRVVIEQAVNIGKYQMKKQIQSSIDVMELLMKNEEVENKERFDLVVKFIDSLRKEIETLFHKNKD